MSAFDVSAQDGASEGRDRAALSPQSPKHRDSVGGSRSGTSSSNVTIYQTTGPDAHTGPIMSPGGSGPALNPRSCVTCRRRKVRCDKQMPCSNCRRAQIPCLFPAPGRAPRQQKPKDPNAPPKSSSQREAELIKRLRKLEGIVEELSGQIEVESGGGSRHGSSSESPHVSQYYTSDSVMQNQPSSTLDLLDRHTDQSGSSETQSESLRKRDVTQRFGRMVLGDQKGTSRYVSSGFWAKMNDEIDAIREETQKLTDDDDESDYEESPTDTPDTAVDGMTDHHAFILGYRSVDVDLASLHPLPSHATFLWSVYQENVEPLMKILHVPTMDLVMRDARKNTALLSPGQEALVFVIYFSAITALEPEEAQTNFGSAKDKLLAKYRFAVEQALAKADYLNTSDIAVLQAFVLFLIVARRHDDSRFCWTLTSLVIRIAQGMGLHRDGSHFGFPPFETEMRRRLWWGMMTLDLRSAEELGTDMAINDRAYDTKIPLNINDADICPESTDFPEPREGRSDCAVATVRYEICGMARRIHTATSATASMCPRADDTTAAEKEQMLIEVYQRIEDKFLRHVVEDTDPLYWVVAMIARVIMAKTCLVIYHPLMFPGSEEQLSNEVRQRIFVAAIEIIECNYKLSTDPRCKQYRWLFQTYTMWHAISYVLLEACRRPWTALVERAWQAVNVFEGDPTELAKKADHAAVFLPLRKLFARARKRREVELSRLRSNPEEARRLDFAERMNPEAARFGPVPGAENVMDQARENWRLLIKTDGATPTPFMNSDPTAEVFNAIKSRQAPGASGQQHPTVPLPTGDNSTTNDVDYAMNFVDVIMGQHNMVMQDLWGLTEAEKFGGVAGVASAPNQSTPEQLQAQQEALRQQALIMQMQPPKAENLPPQIWTDPFTSMNTKFEDVLADDTDMLGDDFNWQDWSQSIRGLEMESTQPPAPSPAPVPQQQRHNTNQPGWFEETLRRT